MLLKIIIENFRSIKDRMEFSFEATSFKEHVSNIANIGGERVLKSSAIYGANASGKSNVLRAFTAIDWEKSQLVGDIPESVKEKIKEEYSYRIKNIHKIYEDGRHVGEQVFDKGDESKGTQSLFVLAGIILEALEGGCVLVVDEFEKHLHPHVTKSLLKLFHDTEMNKNHAQLIFATHDLSQLDSDIFRRDQIWFTEKNEAGETDLFCLADIVGVRNNVPYDKWYDSGKFGAVPVINELEMSL